ncbi:MAG: ABC transporter ATP-binding protein, partial [Candidatus Omnitrophica bacterium]|nr:ABC transporter ATP-binding protein [Candidatus Omnitrophota bacterium]
MYAIELENISKKYILKYEKGAFIKDILPRLFIPKEEKEFWALKDINLKIEEGACLGILGRNGAGKSTLLNIMAGISAPTEGKVRIKGKISTLLTLGAGFHPELTGIDNIYLNGVILGMKIKEIKERLNKIIEFSELGDFIKQPLYTYSSGMILRLGFSIVIHTDFDILLIDEIISVGDIPFQEKCIKKINEFKEEGRKTLVIASQSLDMVKMLSPKALLLDKGRMLLLDNSENVIKKYLEIIKEKPEEKSQYPILPKYPEDIEKIKIGWGTCFENEETEIIEVKLKDKQGKEKNIFKTGESFKVEVKYKVNKEIIEPHFGVAIFREDYLYCYGPNTLFDKIKINKLNRGVGYFRVEYKKMNLGEGNYCISVAIWDKEEKNPYAYHYAYYRFRIGEKSSENQPLLIVPCILKVNGRRTSCLNHSLFFKKMEKSQEEFIRIEEVNCLNKFYREKTNFRTNEKIRIEIKANVLRKIEAPVLGIRLYLQNYILIQEANFSIDKEFSPGEIRISIIYPYLPLLRGNYSLDMAI